MIRRFSITALVLLGLALLLVATIGVNGIVAILVALGVVDKPITNFAALGTVMIITVWGGLLLLVGGTVLLLTDGIARKGAWLFLSELHHALVGSGRWWPAASPPASVSPPIKSDRCFGIWLRDLHARGPARARRGDRLRRRQAQARVAPSGRDFRICGIGAIRCAKAPCELVTIHFGITKRGCRTALPRSSANRSKLRAIPAPQGCPDLPQ
jgi:hypothetical protein